MIDFPWLARWQPEIRAILRIVVALLFLEHATMKFFHFPAPQMPGPLPPIETAAGVIELLTGIFVTLGLFTRLFAFLAAGEMAVGYWTVHAKMGFWPGLNHGEAAILFCFIFLYLAAAGPGAWSLDAVLFRRRAPAA